MPRKSSLIVDHLHRADMSLLLDAYTIIAGLPLPADKKQLHEFQQFRLHLLARISDGPNYRLTQRQVDRLE